MQIKYSKTSLIRASDRKKGKKGDVLLENVAACQHIIFISPISFTGLGGNGNVFIKSLCHN